MDRIELLYIFNELMYKRGLKTVSCTFFLCCHYDFALNKITLAQ